MLGYFASSRGVTCVRRQMTIFYAGQAHVFDDVHPDKVRSMRDGFLHTNKRLQV